MEHWTTLNLEGWVLTIVKVKSHLTSKDVEEGRIEERLWLGNSKADHWAGKGSEIYQVKPDFARDALTADLEASEIRARIVEVVKMQPHSSPDKEDNPARIYPNLNNDIKELGHTIVTQGARTCCDKCGQSWTKGTRAHLISLGPCPGLQPWVMSDYQKNRPIRVREHQGLVFNGVSVNPSHRLRWYRGVLYCLRCGAYSVTRVRTLASPCKMKTSTEGCLRRIRDGKFPNPKGHWPLPEGEQLPAHICWVCEDTDPR